MSRRLLFLLPLLTLALMTGFFAWSLLAGRDPASIGSVMIGRPAPRLDLPAIAPGEPPLDDAMLRTGKPVLVNFFASWCAPCLAEHPLFMRLRDREGAAIIGVAWKNKREDATAWLEEAPAYFPDAGAGAEFLAAVVLRRHVPLLGPERGAAYCREVAERLLEPDGRMVIDYVRLNMRARRPGGGGSRG